MRFLKHLRPAGVALALVATSLGAVMVSTASASADARFSTATTALSAGATKGQFATQAVSPSGCYGRSDNPHLSDHVPGTVNAEGHTICNNVVPELYVRTELIRFSNGAWGLVNWDYGLDFQKTGVSANVDELFCHDTAYYALDSYHEVLDVDRQYYWGWTGSPVVSITCPS